MDPEIDRKLYSNCKLLLFVCSLDLFFFVSVVMFLPWLPSTLSSWISETSGVWVWYAGINHLWMRTGMMLTKSTSSPNKVLSSMNSLDDGSYFVLKRNINTILKSAVVRTSLALTTSSLDCQHTSNIMTTRYDIARWLNYKTLCRKWSLLYLLKVCFIKFTSYCRVLSNSCTTLHDRGGDSGIYCYF